MNDSLVKSTIVMVIVGKKNSDREIKKKRAAKMKGRESMGERERMRVSPRVEVRDRSLLPRSTSSTWYLLLGKRGGEEGEQLRGVVPTRKEKGKEGRVMLKGDRKYTVIVTI